MEYTAFRQSAFTSSDVGVGRCKRREKAPTSKERVCGCVAFKAGQNAEILSFTVLSIVFLSITDSACFTFDFELSLDV
jgi:hypothetical protein